MRPFAPARARSSCAAALLLALAVLAASTGCRNVLTREYEYEEEVYLALDGSATIYINASVPALVALRGASLPLDPSARLDRAAVREFFSSPVTDVRSVSLSRREGRRYVHVRLETPDVRQLAQAAPFAWAGYAFERRGDQLVYAQQVGASAGRPVEGAGWDGDELVAVRLHLPSRVPFHNAPSKTIERGNIIVWEQPLTARQAGSPLAIEVHLEPSSILAGTLSLFAAMAVLALGALAGFVWWTSRRGRRGRGPASGPAHPDTV